MKQGRRGAGNASKDPAVALKPKVVDEGCPSQFPDDISKGFATEFPSCPLNCITPLAGKCGEKAQVTIGGPNLARIGAVEEKVVNGLIAGLAEDTSRLGSGTPLYKLIAGVEFPTNGKPDDERVFGNMLRKPKEGVPKHFRPKASYKVLCGSGLKRFGRGDMRDEGVKKKGVGEVRGKVGDNFLELPIGRKGPIPGFTSNDRGDQSSKGKTCIIGNARAKFGNQRAQGVPNAKPKRGGHAVTDFVQRNGASCVTELEEQSEVGLAIQKFFPFKTY